MTVHRHFDEDAPPCVALDDRHCLIEHHGPDGTVQRFTFAHERPDTYTDREGLRCEGTVWVAARGDGRPVWGMAGSLADGTLTLTPSIRCVDAGYCGGDHGWVRDGQWVPA